MKISLRSLIFLMTLLCCYSLFAQNGWIQQTNPLGFGDDAMLGKIQFVNSLEGWISCGNGGLLHTTNAGDVWDFVNPFPLDTVQRFSDPAIAMSWINSSYGWIIGTIGGLSNPGGAVVYYTTNGGVNWQKKEIVRESGTMGVQVQFVDENTGYVLLYNFATGIGSSFKSTDGGNNWAPSIMPGIFYFVNNDFGWAYNGSGTNGSEPPYKIFNTTNGGTSWNEQFSDVTIGEYNAIHFTNIFNGWVVGREGKVIKTTDGGTTWNFVTNTGINPDESAKTVFFYDDLIGWIPSKLSDAEQTPVLYQTTDGGTTWTTIATPFGSTVGSNAIFNIYFLEPTLGWCTADLGRIAKYTGFTDIQNSFEPVNDYYLLQNYPNPFNPSTIISYSIKEEGLVTLKVLNVLGKEVATLINENKPEGNYEVEFDASQLSSGMYIYSIQAGDLKDSKKMLLMK